MAFDWCPKCKKFDWLERHKCPPRFEVLISDDHDWVEVFAVDEAAAAAKACENYDNFGDYTIITTGEQAGVKVRKKEGGEVKIFHVTAESIPSYAAVEVKPKQKEETKSSG